MTSRVINGVRTTGIYCRDGCSGMPLARNVTHYPSPIAAEAQGFRPCLRCRPDRLPPHTPPGETLVARAIRMIGDGALDAASEEDLARSLGVSARHLRRLFVDEIGATPDFIARSRRAHFARRLLDETDLPMTVMASAAGFNSIRQMNRVVAQTFRFSPSELRAKRRDADRMIADGGVRLRVPFDGSVDFGRFLQYMRPRAIPGVESVDDAVYRRTIVSCEHPGVIEVTYGDRRHLHVTAHLPSLGALIDAVSRVRRLTGLDQSPGVAALLGRDPMLRTLISRRPVLRVPGAWDAFEVSVRILIGQQVSVRGASTLTGRLVQACGGPFDGIGALGLTHTFPSAERIAGSRIDSLRETGLTAARAEAVRSFARAYVAGSVRLDGSRTLDDMVDELASLPGVGAWSAHMIAMRAGSHLDAFPAGDLGLRRAMAQLLRRDDLPSPAELLEHAEAWRPYRAIAGMYLWSTLAA